MKLLPEVHASQLNAIREYVLSHGLPFNANDSWEWRQLWHKVTIPVGRDVTTEIFNAHRSSDATTKEVGCNLAEAGKLEPNESAIVAEMWIEPVDVTSALIYTAVQKFFAHGILTEFNVANERRMRERRLSRFAKRAGFQPLTAGEGAGAATIAGAASLDDGLQLALPDRLVIRKGDTFGGKVLFRHASDLGSAIELVFSLWALVVTTPTA